MPRRKRSKPLVISSMGAIEHILEARPERLREVVFKVPRGKMGGRLENIYASARSSRVSIHFENQGPKVEDPIYARVHSFEYSDFGDLLLTASGKKQSVVLALDHLQDPQNFGALCRTADALGIEAVVIPQDRGVDVGVGAYHSSVGAVETVPICRVVNLADSLRKLKQEGYWVVGASFGDEAKTPWETPDFEKVVLVLGSEYEGLSRSIQAMCDWELKIPMQGAVASLNVSVAGALLMYEFWRRYKDPKSLES